MLSIEFSDTAVLSMCATMLSCTLILSITFCFTSKKKRKNDAKAIEDEGAKPKKRPHTIINSGNDLYACRHVKCNRAPPPESNPYESDKKKWRDEHELAMARLHKECRTQFCEHCISLFGRSAKDYLICEEYRWLGRWF